MHVYLGLYCLEIAIKERVHARVHMHDDLEIMSKEKKL